MYEDHAAKNRADPMPSYIEVASKIWHSSVDPDWRVDRNHVGERTYGELGHVGANVEGVMEVDFPWGTRKGRHELKAVMIRV